ncbi:MAG: hypothetical protein WB495_15675 [Xanthobacteraceae bacterium]
MADLPGRADGDGKPLAYHGPTRDRSHERVPKRHIGKVRQDRPNLRGGGIDIDFGLDSALGHLNARCYGTMTGILRRNALKLHAGLALTSSLAISALPR